jgi:asparagine synthase (glutamine-hydrolysing)
LKPLFDDALSHDAITRRGLFDPEAVARLRNMDKAGRLDAGYPLLAALCVELWCRIFLDGSGQDAPSRLYAAAGETRA